MSKPDQLRIPEYLLHIAEAIQRIERYTAGMSAADFLIDEKTQDAVVRNIEIIGEASNNISKRFPDFSARHNHIPWGFAYEMRNALAHGYHKVDWAIVWKTIQTDLPQLLFQIQQVASNEGYI